MFASHLNTINSAPATFNDYFNLLADSVETVLLSLLSNRMDVLTRKEVTIKSIAPEQPSNKFHDRGWFYSPSPLE